jgi:hypothetical protein
MCFTLGGGVAAWATKVVGSTTMAPLLAGTAVLLDPVEGLVDQVGMVLPAAAVLLVGMGAVTEAISNERAQEVSMTGTQNGHDIRFFAIGPPQGMCKWVV